MDARGKTVDFRLSPKRDVAGAKAFSRKAFKTQGRVPRTITMTDTRPPIGPFASLGPRIESSGPSPMRSCQYLNNIVERDHRGVKRRLRPMLALKNVGYAAITIAGVELLHRIRISLRSVDCASVAGRHRRFWIAVLAA